MLSPAQYHHQDVTLTSHVLPSNSQLAAPAALLTPFPKRVPSGNSCPHSWHQARAEKWCQPPSFTLHAAGLHNLPGSSRSSRASPLPSAGQRWPG